MGTVLLTSLSVCIQQSTPPTDESYIIQDLFVFCFVFNLLPGRAKKEVKEMRVWADC